MDIKILNNFKKINTNAYLVKQLTTAVTAQYCRQTSTAEKDLVFDTLDLITKTKNYRGYSCNSCVFRAFNTVGKEFLKWQQRQNEVIQTPENNTETVETKEVKKDVKSTASKTKKTVKKDGSKSKK